MSEQTTEIASAVVRFLGDLKPLEKAVAGVKSALGTVEKSKFGSSIITGAMNAGKSLLDLAKHAFYVREALRTVVSVASALSRAFLEPAMSFEKTVLAIKGITGSAETANAMMGMLNDTAMQFGLSLADLREQAVTLTVLSEGDVAQAEQYAKVLARINSLRPDLPAQRQLGVIFALKEGDFARASMLLDIPAEKLRALAGIAEDTSETVSEAVGDIGGGGEEALGKFTSIVREAEGSGACGKKLAENLKKGLSPEQINALMSALGASDEMMEGVAGGMLGNIERLKNAWLDFRTTVGTKVMEALAGPLAGLVEWLQDNEELVIRVAEAFGTFIADGIQALLAWLDDDGFEKLTSWLESLPGLIESVMTTIGPLIDVFADLGIGKKPAKEVAKTAIEKVSETGKQAQGGIAAWWTRLMGGDEEAQARAAKASYQGRGARGGITYEGIKAEQQRIRSSQYEKYGYRLDRPKAMQVEVKVGVDPRNGSLKPYVEQEMNRGFGEVAAGMSTSASWGYAP